MLVWPKQRMMLMPPELGSIYRKPGKEQRFKGFFDANHRQV